MNRPLGKPRLWLLASTGLILLLGLVACTSRTGRDDSGVIPWDNLVGNGIDVADVTSAEAVVTFHVVVPDKLGTPVRIVVTDPASSTPEIERALGLLYDDPAYGRYWVLEYRGEVTQEDLLTLLDCRKEKGCEGTRDPLELGGGVTGVIIGGEEADSVRWIMGGTTFDVIGPARTLSTDEAAAIAKVVAAEATAKGTA